jgi:hypothetical protein
MRCKIDRSQRSDRSFEVDGQQGHPHRLDELGGGAAHNSENLNLVASPKIAATAATIGTID